MPFSAEQIQALKIQGYTISSNRSHIQTDVVLEFLHHSYWASATPAETILKSINNSLCFGIYSGESQIGFARVISDKATFAYLADVFVLEAHRGKGLSKWLMQEILAHPELQGLRRWMLATLDAHELYRQFGFQALSDPGRYMERFQPGKSEL